MFRPVCKKDYITLQLPINAKCAQLLMMEGPTDGLNCVKSLGPILWPIHACVHVFDGVGV